MAKMSKEQIEVAKLQIKTAEDNLKAAENQLKRAEMQQILSLKTELEIKRPTPLQGDLPELVEFAQTEGLDPKWFFHTINALALFRMRWPLFGRLPDKLNLALPNDTFKLGEDQNLKWAFSTFIHGSYDDRSEVPDAINSLEKGRLSYQEQEYRFGLDNHKQRLSPVFKWLGQHAYMMATFNEFGYENRKKCLIPDVKISIYHDQELPKYFLRQGDEREIALININTEPPEKLLPVKLPYATIPEINYE